MLTMDILFKLDQTKLIGRRWESDIVVFAWLMVTWNFVYNLFKGKTIIARKIRPDILTEISGVYNTYTLNPWREVEDGLTSSPRSPTFYTSFNHSIQSRRQLREKNLERRNPSVKNTLGVK